MGLGCCCCCCCGSFFSCFCCGCCCCCCCCIGPFIVRAGPGVGGGIMGRDWFCSGFGTLPWLPCLLKLLGPFRFWFWNGWFLKCWFPIPPRIGPPPPPPPPLRGWKLFIPKPPRLLWNRFMSAYLPKNFFFDQTIRENWKLDQKTRTVFKWVKLFKMATGETACDTVFILRIHWEPPSRRDWSAVK